MSGPEKVFAKVPEISDIRQAVKRAKRSGIVEALGSGVMEACSNFAPCH